MKSSHSGFPFLGNLSNSRWQRGMLVLLLPAFLAGSATADVLQWTLQSGNNLTLIWPTNNPDLGLQYATDLPSTNWIWLTNTSLVNGQFTVDDPVTDVSRFYRLKSRHCAGYSDAPPIPVAVNDGTELVGDGITPVTVEGSVDTLIDASQCIDPRHCGTNDTLTYHWVIDTPLVSSYSARGITGYHSPVLSILTDSIPNFSGNVTVLQLTVTHQPFDFSATTSQTTTRIYRTADG